MNKADEEMFTHFKDYLLRIYKKHLDQKIYLKIKNLYGFFSEELMKEVLLSINPWLNPTKIDLKDYEDKSPIVRIKPSQYHFAFDEEAYGAWILDHINDPEFSDFKNNIMCGECSHNQAIQPGQFTTFTIRCDQTECNAHFEKYLSKGAMKDE